LGAAVTERQQLLLAAARVMAQGGPPHARKSNGSGRLERDLV